MLPLQLPRSGPLHARAGYVWVSVQLARLRGGRRSAAEGGDNAKHFCCSDRSIGITRMAILDELNRLVDVGK